MLSTILFWYFVIGAFFAVELMLSMYFKQDVLAEMWDDLWAEKGQEPPMAFDRIMLNIMYVVGGVMVFFIWPLRLYKLVTKGW